MPVAVLLALVLGGAGFHGDPPSVLASSPERLGEIADRRAPVVGVSVAIWLAALGLALAASRERAGPGAARLFALSLAYLPLLLLGGAALQPEVGAERLGLLLGAPALAALTLAALGGYRALAVACGATALAHAADLLAGSPLTRLSLAGPNPAAGHRFYGIGNELEAILIVLVLVGTGAALTTFAPAGWGKTPKRRRGRGAATFLGVAAAFAFVFAYGRFGADVGAAIALPLGGAVAAALLVNRPRLALLALLTPVPALAILVAADLLGGADAHLTRTVLQEGDGEDVGGVLWRRLREAGESFGRPVLLVGLPFVLAGGAAAWTGRRRIDRWLRGAAPVRAGLLGALAAILVATLANDSGALLLELGGAYLLAFLGFAWAERSPPRAAPRVSMIRACQAPRRAFWH